MSNSETKTILLAGGTGLVGNRLADHLRSKNFKVIFLSRKAPAGDPSLFNWNPEKQTINEEAIQQADVIINLAGTGIAGKRWSAGQKRSIVNSRYFSTELLYQSLARIPNKVSLVINASAIGIYGNNGNLIIREDAHPAKDFLGRTCRRWEETASKFATLNKRLVIFRIGLVMTKDGGFLKELLKPLKFGIAPVFGCGEQYQSWIHIDDLCGMMLKAILNNKIEGTYNAVAPCPLSNYNLMKLINQLMGQKAMMIKIPGFIMKLILGEMSVLLLEGSRVSSKKIEEAGYQFKFPLASNALRDLL